MELNAYKMTNEEQITYYRKRLNLFLDFLDNMQKERQSGSVDLNSQIRTLANRAERLADLQALNQEIDRWIKNLPTKKDTEDVYRIFKTELGEENAPN